MITSSPVPEQRGWNPIPHDTARDRRIDRRDLGVLVEVLSYPPGWEINADKLADIGHEGRNAMRASIGRLEAAGYIVHVKYQGDRGRWLTASFAGNLPGVAQQLADQWVQERERQKASSDRGTADRASADRASVHRSSADRPSVNRALSTERPTTKTEEKTIKKDPSTPTPTAASQRACLAADGKPSAKQVGVVEVDPIKAELAEYRRQMHDLSDATIDAALTAWEESRPKMYAWALNKAEKQSRIVEAEANEADWWRLRRIVFKWALTESANTGDWHDDLVDAFRQSARVAQAA